MNESQLLNDRYRLVRPIAQEVTGNLYLGVDTFNDEQIAIKILRSNLFDRQPELLTLFKQEAEALRQLNHPNIVHFSEFFELDGTYYLVMEYVAGGSLHDRLQRGKLSIERVLEVGLDLADALARAHRLGIIHRDVKPHNILLAADGTPCLSDFGLAYFTQHRPPSSPGDPAGTPFYMPPESFQGQQADERTDIWSLGVVLFEMLTGELPFTAETTEELIPKIMAQPVPDLRSLRPELPVELGDLVDLMLVKRHQDRIPSIRLVGAALEAITNGRQAMLSRLTDTGSHRLEFATLPEPPTSFIGRKEALAEIVALFDPPGGHLITLIGPGGVGKTRLALQAARELIGRYHDGIFFADLSSVLAPELVASRIAQALSIKEASNRPVQDDLHAFFGGRQCLLLLDNFEQVIKAAPVVSNLTLGAPELDIMVTSREALRLSGERIYQVQPLSLPDLARDASPMALSTTESIDLFVQRAAAAQPGLRLTAANARDIAEICIHLDGLPLAIELAAARTRILPLGYLRKELYDVFSLLADGPRDAVARQQTLRATIDWSYNLLGEREKALFARLAIFQGGGTLEAIERVCAPELSAGMVSGLESLVSKSLLELKGEAETEPRFSYLETIRQYARQRLEESGQAAIVQQRHADYFLNLAETLVPQLAGPDQEKSLGIIRSEYDNLRAVMTWSLEGENPLLGLRLISALADFWYYEGLAIEGRRWTEEALHWTETVPPSLQARFFNGAGLLAFNRGDHEHGTLWNQQALAIARNIDDKFSEAWALFWLSAHATSSPSKYEQGISFCRQALLLFHEIDDQYGLSWGYNQIGELSRMLGDYEQAQEAYLQSLAISVEAENIRREAIALSNLGYVAQHQGAYAKAEMYILEGLALLYHLRLVHYSAISLATLGGPLAALGDASRAATLMGASEAVFARISMSQQPADQMEIDRYISQIRERLSDAEFQAAWSDGQAMSFDEAIAFAFLKKAS
jgi:non-specific serine/threonine protein kinase